MSDKLNFSLPPQKTKPPVLLLVILSVLCLSLGLQVFILLSGLSAPGGGSPASQTAGSLPAAAQKELALKLQKNSLHAAAVQAWQDYLAVARPNAEDSAAIWYTIGKIQQEAGSYEAALDSYYRAEALHKREDIQDELNRRIQDCLEFMGKFAALRYELADRVGLKQDESGAEVLAEIGTEKITRADLDSKIEQYIDFQMAQYAAYLDPETLSKQKEDLFKYYASEEGQQEMLNNYIVEEVLYRKAREEQLAEDPVTRAMLRTTERQVLARQLIAKKKGDLINITESDLAAYYEARKGDYIVNGIRKSLADVKDELYTKLIAEKEKQVEQQLIGELQQQYNVVVHSSRLKKEASETDEK